MVRKEGRMMCGITAYWAKEAVLTRNEYDVLFEGAALRGRDGVGISIIYSDGASEGIREVAPYDEVREKVLDFVCGTMDVGSILLASFRATPETEPTTTIDMIQPLVHPTDNLYLVHNGGVTDSVKNSMEMSYDYETPLDSEAIFASYILNNNNMISAMENLSGSFAFVMVDKQKDILYAVTSPLSWSISKRTSSMLSPHFFLSHTPTSEATDTSFTVALSILGRYCIISAGMNQMV
jgi:glutamine phosphoribosylpyrophosphate amidotransferase